MKEEASLKDYIDKVMKVVNQLRLLGEVVPEKRVVNKILVSLPEKFKAKISSLEDSKDLSSFIVVELVNALQALKQRRAIQVEDHTESALVASYNASTPSIFFGENYPIWAVKMTTFLKAFDLWEVIEIGGDPPIQKDSNLTLAQIKQHSEEVTKRYKALSYLQFAVSDSIFTKIMTFDNPKEVWDKLR
ncbi:protein of unknown function DUF4219 - like 10 [Theobroma cacao]|nr:protein of unknown function DUF4219 - like 10 [Theobroma cacao]